MLGLMQGLAVDGGQDPRTRRRLAWRTRDGVPFGGRPDRADHLRRDPRLAKRLSGALLVFGVQPGDRVATLAWNSGRHIEAWYAVMGIGAVCHTLNPRLFIDQICYIVNHAQDRIIFTDLTFLPILIEHQARMPSVERFIVITDDGHMQDTPLKGAVSSERLIDTHSADVRWGGFDERTACGLCYTSGTTGNPKGVLYSHRSNFLHTLVTVQTDVMGLSVRDTVLVVVPMFHANAWGLPFSAPAAGAKLVMPGPKMDGASILELLETEQVTFSAAVPTVWQMLLQHLRATGEKLTSLKRVVIGGSAVPEAIIRAPSTTTTATPHRNYPSGKIAVLSSDDDFGRDNIKGLKDGLGDAVGNIVAARMRRARRRSIPNL
jgi:fatty-acyl-CoA synthase